VSLVFACIAPHGDVDLDPTFRPAMEELGRRFAAAEPEVAVVVTPHNVHVDGHYAVITAGRVGEWETDAAAAEALLAADLPILGVSYGGNDPPTAEMPIDWGTEIPLTFMRAPKVVVVSPARDRPLEEHLKLGAAIAALPGRVALIASADHGHAHRADGI
jgi:aromatic ring-opening dioxygenase LigB subunit